MSLPADWQQVEVAADQTQVVAWQQAYACCSRRLRRKWPGSRPRTELREEIARLKGFEGMPRLKPRGMEKATEAAAKGSGGKSGAGPSDGKLTIDETRMIKPEAVRKVCVLQGDEDLLSRTCCQAVDGSSVA